MTILVITEKVRKKHIEGFYTIEEICSHGIDYELDATIPLPQVHPSEVGAVFDLDWMEWFIED